MSVRQLALGAVAYCAVLIALLLLLLGLSIAGTRTVVGGAAPMSAAKATGQNGAETPSAICCRLRLAHATRRIIATTPTSTSRLATGRRGRS